MTNCTVKTHFGSYLVDFGDGMSLLLQTDYDQAAFAVSCGLIEAPDDWDGCPEKLGQVWIDCDITDIEKCPLDYYDVATCEPL